MSQEDLVWTHLIDGPTPNPSDAISLQQRLACVRCESPSVRRLSLIYEEGISRIDEVSRSRPSIVAMLFGAPVVSGRVVERVTGSHQTTLSRRVAPPLKPRAGMVVGSASLFLLWTWASAMEGFGLATASPAVILLGVTLLLFRRHTAHLKHWKTAHEAWASSYLCCRCGATFIR